MLCTMDKGIYVTDSNRSQQVLEDVTILDSNHSINDQRLHMLLFLVKTISMKHKTKELFSLNKFRKPTSVFNMSKSSILLHLATSVFCVVCNSVTPVPHPGMFKILCCSLIPIIGNPLW